MSNFFETMEARRMFSGDGSRYVIAHDPVGPTDQLEQPLDTASVIPSSTVQVTHGITGNWSTDNTAS